MFDSLLKYVSDQKGSDLHLKYGSQPIMRKNKLLSYIPETKVILKEDIDKILKGILSEQEWKVLKKKFSFDLSYEIEKDSRFRINVSKDREGYLLVVRVIPFKISSMDELKIPSLLKSILEMRDGIVLITGATGNGKSTTVAAILEYINKYQNKRIYTLEDPIEYRFEDKQCIITQRELGKEIVSFNSALKYVLRQDPDIIFVGEMRDRETIKAAIKAAETGHLVISTIHTRDTSQTIDRIIDMFSNEEQNQIKSEIAHLFQMIISQQLIPNSSEDGMVLATEILVCTPAISNLIREGKIHQIQSQLEIGRQYGMHTFESSLKKLYEEEAISKEEYEKRLVGQAIYKNDKLK